MKDKIQVLVNGKKFIAEKGMALSEIIKGEKLNFMETLKGSFKKEKK